MSTLRLPVPIPCLDEAETVATCVTKAIGWMDRHGVDGEVLVADNCSTYLERCLLIGTLPTSGGSRLPDVSPPRSEHFPGSTGILRVPWGGAADLRAGLDPTILDLGF